MSALVADRWFVPRVDGVVGKPQEGLAEHPGRITELLDRRFRVVQSWPQPRIKDYDLNDHLYTWPVGTEGWVTGVKFSTLYGWQVCVEREANEWLPCHEAWPDIDIDEFLACTEPLEPVPVGPPRWLIPRDES